MLVASPRFISNSGVLLNDAEEVLHSPAPRDPPLLFSLNAAFASYTASLYPLPRDHNRPLASASASTTASFTLRASASACSRDAASDQRFETVSLTQQLLRAAWRLPSCRSPHANPR
jgi:hypothetical protein